MKPALLSPAQLEELRLLSNSDMDSASPFAALLVDSQPWPTGCVRACLPPSTSGSRSATRWGRNGPTRVRRLPAPPPHTGRTERPAHCRRCRGTTAPLRQRTAPSTQQRRHRRVLMAWLAESKGLVDDTCAKKAVAELTRN